MLEVISAWSQDPTVAMSMYRNHGMLQWLINSYNNLPEDKTKLRSTLYHLLFTFISSLLKYVEQQKITGSTALLCNEILLILVNVLPQSQEMQIEDTHNLLKLISTATALLKDKGKRKGKHNPMLICTAPDLSSITEKLDQNTKSTTN